MSRQFIKIPKSPSTIFISSVTPPRHTPLVFNSYLTYCKFTPYFHHHPRYLHSSRPKPSRVLPGPVVGMMSTGRTMEGSTLREMLTPAFRKVKIQESTAVGLVCRHLRVAWVTKPFPSGSFQGWMQSLEGKPIAAQNDPRAPKNQDLSTLSTPWRDDIYYHWNHVFYDTFNFLQQVGIGIGEFNPPSHEILPLYSSGQDQQQATPLEKVWENNIVLCWAYLAPGVKVRMFKAGEGENEQRKEYGVFDEEKTGQVWFLRKGTKVVFEIEGVADVVQDGLAAVLVLGIGSDS